MEKVKLDAEIAPTELEKSLLSVGEKLGYFVKPEDMFRIVTEEPATEENPIPFTELEYLNTRVLFANQYTSFEIVFDKFSTSDKVLNDGRTCSMYNCDSFWAGKNSESVRESDVEPMSYAMECLCTFTNEVLIDLRNKIK